MFSQIMILLNIYVAFLIFLGSKKMKVNRIFCLTLVKKGLAIDYIIFTPIRSSESCKNL